MTTNDTPDTLDPGPAFAPFSPRDWRDAYTRLEEANEPESNNLFCAVNEAFNGVAEAFRPYGLDSDKSDHAEALVGALLRFLVASNPSKAHLVPTPQAAEVARIVREALTPPPGYEVFETPGGRWGYERRDGQGAGVGYVNRADACRQARAHAAEVGH